MKCVLCRKTIGPGEPFQTDSDTFSTYVNEYHKRCFTKYRRWMQMQVDKEAIVISTCRDATTKYSFLKPGASPLPDYFYKDDLEYVEGPKGDKRRIAHFSSTLPSDEYPRYAYPYSRKNYIGPDIDWYGFQGTARWEVEPV